MNYRQCTESLSATVKELESENLDPVKASLLNMELDALAVKTPALYDELLSFAKESSNEQKGPEFAFNRAKLIRQDSVCFSPRKGVPAPARDPTTGKGKLFNFELSYINNKLFKRRCFFLQRYKNGTLTL